MDRSALPAGVAKAIERLRRALEERFGDRLELVRLFGSYARGDAWEESDVDLLLLIRDVTPSERNEVVTLAYHAGDLSPDDWLVLSPLVRSLEQFEELRRQERRIARDIAREGITL